MAAIPGSRIDITGASGSQGLLSPKESWQCYIFPRGAHAAQDSSAALITFDTSDEANRFAANDWIQVGLSVSNIRQVAAVGGNSISVSGGNVTVSENDRVFVIGSTEPTVAAGVATYLHPNTAIYERGDDQSDLVTNSVITTNSDGLIQLYSKRTPTGRTYFDCMIQDGDGTNQGFIADLIIGEYENTVLNVKDFGALGDGVTDDMNAIQAAIDAAIGRSGGTIYFPQATYVCDDDVTIGLQAKNIFIDLNGSIIKSSASGNPKFRFTGDTGTDGDFSEAPQNCWIFNGTFGDANDTSNTFLGPDFHFCIDCGARNIIKQGKGGTGYTIRKCRRVVLENCYNYGADPDGNNIGFLVWVSDNCVLRSCYALEGALRYGFQNKGGEGNRYEDCHCVNLYTDGGSTTPVHAFRDRGDAPWKASSSTGTYPFATGAWASADFQRASRNCVFSSCSVNGCTSMIGALIQESVGTQVLNLTVDNGTRLVGINAAAGGQERDFLISGCRGISLGIAGTNEGGGIAVLGTTQISIDGVRIEDCTIEGSYGPGISVSWADQCRIINNRIRNPGQINNGAAVDTCGIYGATMGRAVVSNNDVTDDNLNMVNGIRLVETSSIIWPTVKDNYVTGSTLPIHVWAPGSFSGNRPGDGYGVTTDGSVEDTLWRCHLQDNTAVFIEVTAMAMESDGSQRAFYRVGGLFYRDGGNATQQGSDVVFIHANTAASLTDSSGGSTDDTVSPVTDQSETVDLSVINDNFAEVTEEINALVTDATPDIESEDWGGLGFSVSGNYARVQVTGLAATTINWYLYVKTYEVT